MESWDYAMREGLVDDSFKLPEPIFDVGPKKFIRFSLWKDPDWESIYEFGADLIWAEESVSGYKCQINIYLGKYKFYINIKEIEDEI